jgi:hypothetical protein
VEIFKAQGRRGGGRREKGGGGGGEGPNSRTEKEFKTVARKYPEENLSPYALLHISHATSYVGGEESHATFADYLPTTSCSTIDTL